MGRSRVYVVQVEGGREERFRQAIERQLGSAAEDCFTPVCEIPKKVRGSWRPVRRLLFPGYVFVQTNEAKELLGGLKKVHGFTKLLGVQGDEIQALSDEEVEWLDAVTDAGTHAMPMSEGVAEGDRVIVTRGPLKGQETRISKVDRHKRLAWLEVQMLGRKATVKVGLEVVAKRA